MQADYLRTFLETIVAELPVAATTPRSTTSAGSAGSGMSALLQMLAL